MVDHHDDDETLNPNEIVDDDGHTLADITPWDPEEPDEETVQAILTQPENPEEHANWDRTRDGGMWEYATRPENEPECQTGDSCEKGE